MALGTLAVIDGASNPQTLLVDIQGNGALVPLHGREPTALTNCAAVACSPTPNSAVSVVPYSATRKWLAVFNRSNGQETVDIGSSDVTLNGGIPIQAGAGGYVFDGPGAAGPIYAISPVAGTPLSYVEA